MNTILIKKTKTRKYWIAMCRVCKQQLTVARKSWDATMFHGIVQMKRHKHLTQKDVMKSA